MADLIAVPLKKPSEIDIVKPLKNLIQSTYSTADKPEDYSDAISELNKLRNNAIWRAFEKYESSLEIIYSYYDQICALEGKIPAHELQIPFKWKDAFDKGSIFSSKISLTISSLGYEKICILFNIAALQSTIAAAQTVENDSELKLAAKLFQQSASIFAHLKNTVMMCIQQDPTPDLNPDTLSALSQLMLAQAQEIFVHKAIHDHLKDNIVARLSSQCEDFYSDCLKVFQRDSLRQIWDKDWILIVAGKQAGFHGIAQYYQSLVCKANKSVGEEITRLEHSIELFKAAQQRSGRPTFFQDFLTKATRNLTEAKKDNDFIYHERIPDVKSLDPLGKAALAKISPITHPLSQNFKDLFNELVPVAVHQALAAYDVRKNEIVNAEISKLRDSTQALNGILASLNLPAAIEVTEGSSLPQSILDKAEAVRHSGGIKSIETLLIDLPELFKRNKDILDEAVRLLDEEKHADDSLREQFKEKWNRTPSVKLTELFRANTDKYRQIINNAQQADEVVRGKFEKNKSGILLLSKSSEELQAAVPRGSGSNVTNSPAVQTLRNLMEQVETLKAERDAIESELKSATIDMKSTFLSALAKDGAISEPQMSIESLGQTFGPLQKQVKESIARQEKLVGEIQSANTEFIKESGFCASGRDSILKDLATAYDSYCELSKHLQEGTKFYNDLTQLLVVFQNKISDFCFARKTEKEELMKDLTQESSRQVPGQTPSLPSYYNNPEPAISKKEAPSRPPPPNVPPSTAPSSVPQAGAPNLPYPMNWQGMPVPYGQAAAAPYPTYVPPPMPQGYNPYGTIPYQGAPYNPGAYPGGYPQAPPQNYVNYPPPGQPGGYPQQQQPPPGW